MITREQLAKRRQERRKKNRQKLFLSLAICFFITAIFCGIYAGFNFNLFGNSTSKTTKVSTNISEKKSAETQSAGGVLPSLQKDLTVMLLGVDERNKDVGRSDTLMFLSLSEDKVSLLSIPRDTRVFIENRGGWQKINAAYAHGGEKLTKKTLENFLGVDVNRYVKVNIAEFQKLIDAIGGIDVVVEKDMDYEDPWDDNGGLYIHLDKGLQHLDGLTAMEFVRFRDAEGDAGRVRRQQAFMQACAAKLSDPSTLLKLPEILSAAKDAVETDLSSAEMLAIAGTLKSAEDNNHVKVGTVPGSWQYIGGVSYLVPDVLRLGEVMKQNLGMEINNKHFSELAAQYPPILDYNYYDVNENFEKDFRIMDALEKQNLTFEENNL